MPEKLWMGIPQRFTINGIDGLTSTNIRNGAVERGFLFQAFHKFNVLAGLSNSEHTYPKRCKK